ncbi:nucleoid occlusion factor SlmA [Curvibacter sp. APW13]|uniref:nucleoid occlusion factor SlmA n=1 Tax=Curvibacter sp. APW13 TaxID=3077236 RepID=UPI0028E04AC8|nr:nucleoid occlusion factor SlmA [Curvibacter sp. APW13]MDT8989856.1 nucleoid occlusion factor SlmA [Curvibacter sp. APW13]
MDDTPSTAQAEPSAPLPVRKRPKPGERRLQILQTLAQMLEAPGAERVTTAALAARLSLSEAALYRHFASKAQMFEGLLDFIESSLLTLVNRIATATEGPGAGRRQCSAIVAVVLQFAQKNPGMARVMVGDALVLEHPRLQQRMNQLFDKLEAALRQALRLDAGAAETDAVVAAAVLSAFMVGRLQRFVRSDFARLPTERLDEHLAWMFG